MLNFFLKNEKNLKKPLTCSVWPGEKSFIKELLFQVTDL